MGLDVDAHLAWAKANRPGDLEAAERLLAQAVALKRERSIEWRIKGCGLKTRKTMATFDWDFQPRLDRRAVEELFTLAFVDRHEDLLLTGSAARGRAISSSPWHSRRATTNGLFATPAAWTSSMTFTQGSLTAPKNGA